VQLPETFYVSRVIGSSLKGNLLCCRGEEEDEEDEEERLYLLSKTYETIRKTRTGTRRRRGFVYPYKNGLMRRVVKDA
jgi:hypothetical protein